MLVLWGLAGVPLSAQILHVQDFNKLCAYLLYVFLSFKWKERITSNNVRKEKRSREKQQILCSWTMAKERKVLMLTTVLLLFLQPTNVSFIYWWILFNWAKTGGSL